MTIARIGTEFVPTITVTNDQERPAMTTLPDGRFVITWTDNSQTGADTNATAIRARIFNADGTESVPEFVVNFEPFSLQLDSKITVLEDGRLLFTWSDQSQTDGDNFASAIRGRIFNTDGTESVPQFRVNAVTAGIQKTAA